MAGHNLQAKGLQTPQPLKRFRSLPFIASGQSRKHLHPRNIRIPRKEFVPNPECQTTRLVSRDKENLHPHSAQINGPLLLNHPHILRIPKHKILDLVPIQRKIPSGIPKSLRTLGIRINQGIRKRLQKFIQPINMVAVRMGQQDPLHIPTGLNNLLNIPAIHQPAILSITGRQNISNRR